MYKYILNVFSTPSTASLFFSPPLSFFLCNWQLMGAQEEVMVAGSASSLSWDGELPVPPAVAKGKRTKRARTSLQHQQRPPAAAVCAAVDSPSASSAESFTEEDEDLAVCLILLARGRASVPPERSLDEAAAEGDAVVVGSSVDKFVNRGADEAAPAVTGAGGKLCVYECKTCNKCFPSFQALGGHRASHKKPKLTAESTVAAATVAAAAADDKKLLSQEGVLLPISTNPFSKSNLGSEIGGYGKVKIHECSICGSEFSSGQALGGHMRRHRPAAAAAIQEGKKEDHQRSQLLSLDLNLPAPADDHAAVSRPPSPVPFPFAVGERPLLFAATASALVDCHY